MDLYRIDFSDPQGGKGPCDRKAAQIKTHVKQYINQGHSATTPVDLKKAIGPDEGIVGVRVTFVPVPKTTVTYLTIIPRGCVGYEMIIANQARSAELTICHLTSNKRKWNNCFIKNAHKISLNLPD